MANICGLVERVIYSRLSHGTIGFNAAYAAVQQGYAWVGGLAELRDVTYIDLPASHWPMWSRPRELTEIIGDVAKAHAPAA